MWFRREIVNYMCRHICATVWFVILIHKSSVLLGNLEVGIIGILVTWMSSILGDLFYESWTSSSFTNKLSDLTTTGFTSSRPSSQLVGTLDFKILVWFFVLSDECLMVQKLSCYNISLLRSLRFKSYWKE